VCGVKRRAVGVEFRDGSCQKKYRSKYMKRDVK